MYKSTNNKTVFYNVSDMRDFFKDAKKSLENKIPVYNTTEFEKLRDTIKNKLKEKENEHLLIVRSLKTVILGDWNTDAKKQKLYNIKNTLLKNGIYAVTVDEYYDMDKRDGLSQMQILEFCCIHHQLIVLIDGMGPGTLTEQNYLADNYIFHGKILYFITQLKFNNFKDNANAYFKDFPTIYTYNRYTDLLDKVVAFSKLRMYRLAEIVQKQKSTGRGLNNPNYMSWKRRMSKQGKV